MLLLEFIIDQRVKDVELPGNFKSPVFLKEFQSACPHAECSLGSCVFTFGQSPFHVPKIIQNALAGNTDKDAYAPISGIPELREAIVKYNKHYFDVDVTAQQVFVGPGTKELIYILLEVLHGAVILPTPAWLGYLPQIRFLKKNYHMLPTRENKKINPNDLRRLASKLHDRQKMLILNNPNNPTGLLYDKSELEEIADVCRKQNIIVLADEIYAQITYDMTKFVSMAKVYPEGAFVTNGLSKSHGAGGYRLGYVLFPQGAVSSKNQFEKIQAIEYTSAVTPVQHAAVAGFEISHEIDEYFQITRSINQIMGEYTFNALSAIDGVKATKPAGTFYLLADFNALAAELKKAYIFTSQELSESLIAHPYHVVIVRGDDFVLEQTDLSTRIAYVDYDGYKIYDGYIKNKPETSSEKLEFVREYAPKVVKGIEMIAKFFDDLKNR